MKKFNFEDVIINQNASISQSEASGDKKNKKTRKDKPDKKKTVKSEVCEFLDFGSKIENGRLEITLPIRTVSEANCFEPWRKKHKRHKTQKKTIFFALIEHKSLLRLPCNITYIRYAPKTLDRHDNLPMSMKYLNDQVCAEITQDFRPGRADDSDQIKIFYDQVKSKVYGIKIIIEF